MFQTSCPPPPPHRNTQNLRLNTSFLSVSLAYFLRSSTWIAGDLKVDHYHIHWKLSYHSTMNSQDSLPQDLLYMKQKGWPLDHPLPVLRLVNDYSCMCYSKCVSVNAVTSTNPSQSSAIKRSPGVEYICREAVHQTDSREGALQFGWCKTVNEQQSLRTSWARVWTHIYFKVRSFNCRGWKLKRG
jgi:hypothetical protein